jgi:hypothetical protein
MTNAVRRGVRVVAGVASLFPLGAALLPGGTTPIVPDNYGERGVVAPPARSPFSAVAMSAEEQIKLVGSRFVRRLPRSLPCEETPSPPRPLVPAPPGRPELVGLGVAMAVLGEGPAVYGLFEPDDLPREHLDRFAHRDCSMEANIRADLAVLRNHGSLTRDPAEAFPYLAPMAAADTSPALAEMVSGGVRLAGTSINHADSLIQQERRQARRCYREGLKTDPAMGGGMSFTLSLNSNGNVTDTAMTLTGSLSTGVVDCIKKALSGQRFSVFDGPQPSSLVGQFTLYNANRDRRPPPADFDRFVRNYGQPRARPSGAPADAPGPHPTQFALSPGPAETTPVESEEDAPPPRATASGGAELSGAKIVGVERVIGLGRAKARACYHAGLMTDPTMEGRVSFTLMVGNNGRVTSTSMTPSGELSPGVVSCIKSALATSIFELPEDGGTSRIEGSYTLVNASKGK